MKKILLVSLLMLVAVCGINAQSHAEIKFDELTHDFGTFTDKAPIQKCVFTFTNIGNAPLIIHQAVASCGCTVPSYTKKPIAPGEKGTINVTYNAKGQYPRHFKKTITVRTNAKTEMTRLYIEGTLTE